MGPGSTSRNLFPSGKTPGHSDEASAPALRNANVTSPSWCAAARAKSRQRRADLMRGNDPAEHNARALAAKYCGTRPNGRRHRRDFDRGHCW
jgi:hypothetical protein